MGNSASDMNGDAGGGGAIFVRDRNLTLVEWVFSGNQGVALGPDSGGGALYILGSNKGVLVVQSTFDSNQAANAGALGGLFAPEQIYNSLFTNNKALGHDNNTDDQTHCKYTDVWPDTATSQHEVGSGGNGGAIYSDGGGTDIRLCGDEIEDNATGVNAFGGAVFFTNNAFQCESTVGSLYIADSTILANTGQAWSQIRDCGTVVGSCSASDNQCGAEDVVGAGSAVGTNTVSITVTNSTVQGLGGH